MRDFLYGLDQIPPEQLGSGITREMERRWRVLQGLQVGGCGVWGLVGGVGLGYGGMVWFGVWGNWVVGVGLGCVDAEGLQVVEVLGLAAAVGRG